jgi:hypothetical protein
MPTEDKRQEKTREERYPMKACWGGRTLAEAVCPQDRLLTEREIMTRLSVFLLPQGL